MKPIFIIKFMLLLAIFNCNPLLSAQTKRTITFNLSQFQIIKNEKEEIQIYPVSELCEYGLAGSPHIPFLVRSFISPYGEKLHSYEVTVYKHKIMDNVDLSLTVTPVPSFFPDKSISQDVNISSTSIYPNQTFEESKRIRIGEQEIVHFKVSPFEYHSYDREVYFIDSLKIDMQYKDVESLFADSPITETQLKMIESIVENPEDIYFYEPQELTLSLSDISETTPIYPLIPYNRRVEYVVVTNEELSSAFQRLVDWKTRKGVPGIVLTTDKIYASFTGATEEIKIKKCLQSLQKSHNIQYALLGGDVSVVPTHYEFVKTTIKYNKNSYYSDSIPTDIYYVCLNNPVEGNNSSSDAIWYDDWYPTVAVARAPVESIKDANLFVDRILDYETNPKYNDNILMAGGLLGGNIPFTSTSDAEAKSDALYDSYAYFRHPLRSKMFDTHSDFEVPLNSVNFIDQLNKGYSFVDVISHGTKQSLSYVTDNIYNPSFQFFHNMKAKELENNGHTIFLTSACYTNAFDMKRDSLCLSETLMLNPNSGIVAYWGSSRFGWFMGGTADLTYSNAYEKSFFQHLLSSYPPETDKKFGVIANYVKWRMLGFEDSDNVYKWLHFSMNAIGDPEMPIYTDTPKTFTEVNAGYDNDGNLIISTGEPYARICVTSKSNPDFYYVWLGKTKIENAPEDCHICITNHNFLPIEYDLDASSFVMNSTSYPRRDIVCSPNPAKNNVRVYYTVTPGMESPKIQFLGINTRYDTRYEIDEQAQYADIDISQLPTDIYVVTLIDKYSRISRRPDRLIKN